MVNKKIKSKYFVQFGRKRIKVQVENIEKFEIMRNNEFLWFFMFFLFVKILVNVRLKYLKNKLVVVGLQGLNEVDNNMGIVIFCGN